MCLMHHRVEEQLKGNWYQQNLNTTETQKSFSACSTHGGVIDKHSIDADVISDGYAARHNFIAPVLLLNASKFLVERPRVRQKTCQQQHISNQPVEWWNKEVVTLDSTHLYS